MRSLQVLWVDNDAHASRGSPPDPTYRNRLTTLGELPRFITDLRVTGLPFASPLPVSSMTSLRKLHVSGGQISGLSEVTGLTGLTGLGLRDMGLTSGDLAQLSDLPALEQAATLLNRTRDHAVDN